MKLNIIVLFSIVFSIGLKAQVQNMPVDCEEVISKLDTVMNSETSIQSLEEIQLTDPDLVVLGEYHYDHLFWKMSHVYSYIKNLLPRVNCLYSEIAQDGTQAEILEMMQGKQNELFYTVRRLGFGPLYQYIYDQGDNVILVDAPKSEFSYLPSDNSSSWLTRRDSFMISRIESAQNSNECSAGLYNIGAQHIWDNLNEPGLTYESFGTRVKSRVKTIVIDKGDNQLLNQCEWLGVKSFLAPATNPQVRDFFKLDERQSSADYVLYLRSIDIMHSLTQPE